MKKVTAKMNTKEIETRTANNENTEDFRLRRLLQRAVNSETAPENLKSKISRLIREK